MTDLHGRGPLATLLAYSRCHGAQVEAVAAMLRAAGASPEDDCSRGREAKLQQASSGGLADALANAFEASRPARTAIPPWLLGDQISEAQLDFSAAYQASPGK